MTDKYEHENREVKNIVFDIGRVLLKFEPLEFLLNEYEKDVAILLNQIIFKSKYWLELDRGRITNYQAVNLMSDDHPDLKSEVEKIINNWPEILSPIDKTKDIAIKLKEKGYKMFLLSNFHKEAFLRAYEKYDFFKSFDGFVISYEVFSIKPEDKIFNKLCDKYKIEPEKSLFIDDSKENIIKANKLGFKTIWYTNSIDLEEKICKMKILKRKWV